MGQIDHPVVRDFLSSFEQTLNQPSQATATRTAEPDDDPSAPARGILHGVALGVALWAVILWMLW